MASSDRDAQQRERVVTAHAIEEALDGTDHHELDPEAARVAIVAMERAYGDDFAALVAITRRLGLATAALRVATQAGAPKTTLFPLVQEVEEAKGEYMRFHWASPDIDSLKVMHAYCALQKIAASD